MARPFFHALLTPLSSLSSSVSHPRLRHTEKPPLPTFRDATARRRTPLKLTTSNMSGHDKGFQRKDEPASRLKVIAVVSFYMVSALVMVFVNKAVLNSTPDLPFSFLFIQLVIAVLLLHLVSFAGRLSSVVPRIELPELNPRIAYKLLPITGIAVVGLVFNTLCLASVDASYFQIARGLQLPLTIFVSSLQSRSFPARPILSAAAIVAFGFFLGVIHPESYLAMWSNYTTSTVASFTAGDTATGPSINARAVGDLKLESTAISLLYGFLSSAMIAVHAVMVKPAHAIVDNSVIKLTYWTNLISAVGLIPFILFNNELPPLFALSVTSPDAWRTFVYGSGVTGLFGFLLCMAGLLSITNTSPVTHMFSSAMRSVLQSLLGVWIFGDVITSNRGMSIFVITVGAVYFTWIKAQGQAQAKKKAEPLIPMSATSSSSNNEGSGSTSPPPEYNGAYGEFEDEKGRKRLETISELERGSRRD